MQHLKFEHLKFAGLCLAAVVALSAATAATATAAAPVWETCSTEKAAAAATKYTTSACRETSGSGRWAWQEIPASAPIAIKIKSETLTLKDTKTSLGESTVTCVDSGTGKAGGRVATVETATISGCKAVAGGCESVESAEAVHLPWKTELFETEKKIEQTLAGDGGGEPGVSVKCKTILGPKTDTCEKEEKSADPIHIDLSEFSGEWLVVEFLDDEYKHWKCTEGGTEAGRLLGVEIWLEDGVRVF
jgi:hypothetical protein